MISNEYRIAKFKFELTERENPDNANKACALQMPKQVLQPDVGCRPVDKFSVSLALTLSKFPKTQKYHFRCVGGQFFYFSHTGDFPQN